MIIGVKKCIIHEVTPPYSHESNGVAERKNRTLKEMMNVLLISSNALDNILLISSKKKKIRSKISDCMFSSYVEHRATYRFLVLNSDIIERNTIIEFKNIEFFEHAFPLKINGTSEPSIDTASDAMCEV